MKWWVTCPSSIVGDGYPTQGGLEAMRRDTWRWQEGNPQGEGAG